MIEKNVEKSTTGHETESLDLIKGPEVSRDNINNQVVSEYTSQFYEKMYELGYKDKNGEEDFKIKINSGAELRELYELFDIAETMIFRKKLLDRYDSMIRNGEDPSKWGGIIQDWEHEQIVVEDDYKDKLDDLEHNKFKLSVCREALEFIEQHNEECLALINSATESDYENELIQMEINGYNLQDYCNIGDERIDTKRKEFVEAKKQERGATRFSLKGLVSGDVWVLTNKASIEVNRELSRYIAGAFLTHLKTAFFGLKGSDITINNINNHIISEYTSQFYEKIYKKMYKYGYKEKNREEDFKIKIYSGAELRELKELFDIASSMIYRKKLLDRYDSMIKNGEDPSKWGGIIQDWEHEQTIIEKSYEGRWDELEHHKLQLSVYKEALEFIEQHSEECLALINSETKCDYENELKRIGIKGYDFKKYSNEGDERIDTKRKELVENKKQERGATRFSLKGLVSGDVWVLTNKASIEVNRELSRYKIDAFFEHLMY